MEPSLHNGTRPDVLVTLDSDVLYRNSELVAELQHGDKIRFNCSLHDRERGGLKDVLHFHVSHFAKIGHDSNFALFTTEIEEEWMKIHLEDKGKLRSESDPSEKIEPI